MMEMVGSTAASYWKSMEEHGFRPDQPSSRSWALLAGYFVGLAVLGVVVPGPKIQGVVLADKTRITYKCNGFAVLVVLLAVLAGGASAGFFSPSIIADQGGELFVAALILCTVLSIYLQVVGSLSRSKSTSLVSHATGNVVHDWWFGVQLNPSLLGLDLKFFWIRAGMMGWLLINLSIAAKSYLEHGSLPVSMVLFQVFCLIYVLDYFWFEEYMTSTWDIIAEHFGFMLVMGDVVWIPFTFSIQAWWLMTNRAELTKVAAFMDVVIFLIGYTVFRGSNKQKHIFKKDPKALIWGQPPKVVGGKLLVSGYWGIARHCNYLGDLLVAFSFSLPCGFSSPIPYFYPTYLLILLLWRERRDEAKCRQKYKEVWVEYCKTVPWRIIPGLY
ncbi:protein MpFACKEL [Marchantia polymorpha subsp. ruderalis]